MLDTRPVRMNPHEHWIEKSCVYDESKQLDGVVMYLTCKCGGNVHDKGIVNVTASDTHLTNYAKNAVDLGTPPC